MFCIFATIKSGKMLPEEIKIGDYIKVKSTENNDASIIIKVTQVSLYYVWGITLNGNPVQDVISLTEPIKLTEEILDSNGFTKDGYTNLSWDYCLDDKNFRIMINLKTTLDKRTIIYVWNKHTGRELSIEGKNIRNVYIHELQHALIEVGLGEINDYLTIKSNG